MWHKCSIKLFSLQRHEEISAAPGWFLTVYSPFFFRLFSLWILQLCLNIGAVSAACCCCTAVCPLHLWENRVMGGQRLHLVAAVKRFAPSTLTSWDRPHRVKSLIVSHEGFKGPRLCRNQVVYHWYMSNTCQWILERSLSFYLFFLPHFENRRLISPLWCHEGHCWLSLVCIFMWKGPQASVSAGRWKSKGFVVGETEFAKIAIFWQSVMIWR